MCVDLLSHHRLLALVLMIWSLICFTGSKRVPKEKQPCWNFVHFVMFHTEILLNMLGPGG